MKIHFPKTPITLTSMFVVASIQACVDHKLGVSDSFECAEVVSYAADVSPIINTRCAIVGDGGCHNGGNGPNLDWRQFSNVQNNATDIKDRITRAPGTAGFMPKIGTLTSEQIQLISCWVDQGAKDN